MRVLVWVLVWVVLVAASGWYLWRRLRRLFRTASRLANEVAEAERLLGRVQRQVRARHTRGAGAPDGAPADEANEPDAAVQLAVFTGIAQAAAERRAVREALREQRRARRDANRPGWARRVDSDST